MDFGQVLHTAQKNDKNTNKNGVRYYSTKFEPPKKQERQKKPDLSENIKKFLARKEAEENKRSKEEDRKRDELLALRSQDKKATRRVNVMLKRTKSANQSVIEDATDNDNTAVTLAGPLQPDEDDYGYVSQEASAFYEKMMEKYSKMPDEPKFDMAKKKVSTNLSSTKDRVKAALEKEKEEAMMPHKRKRKRKDKDRKEDDDEEGISYEAPDRGVADKKDTDDMPPPPSPAPKKKPRPMAPPIMNFADLLKIAEKKQHEPILIEKKDKDDESPMTKKQRKEMELEKEARQRREERWRLNGNERFAHLEARRPDNSSRVPKSGESTSNPAGSSISERRFSGKGQLPNKPLSGKDTVLSKTESETSRAAKPSFNKSDDVKNRKSSEENLRPKKTFPESAHSRQYLPGDVRYKSSPQEDPPQRKYLPGDIRAKNQDLQQKKYSSDDIRAKSSSQENEPGSKRYSGEGNNKSQRDEAERKRSLEDKRGKSSPKNEVCRDDRVKKPPQDESPPRKYLPGDVRAKNDDRRKYLPGDVRAKNDDGRKYLPGDIKAKNDDGRKYLAGDKKESKNYDGRKYLPGDIRNKSDDGRKYLPGDIRIKSDDGRKYLPGDLRAKNDDGRKNLPGDLRAKSDDGRKYLPGDVRAKTSQSDAPQRKYLPGDVRAKPSQSDTSQRKYLPGDIRAKGAEDVRQKKPMSNDVKSRALMSEDLKQKKLSSGDAKSKNLRPEETRPRQFPPKDLKPKQFPPPDVGRLSGSSKKKPVIGSKRRILDDDSEYDSEMDDFIDDDDAEFDYSKQISEIFGYDKNRYRDVEDDTENMESTFAQQMREEVISTKIGIMEDLEDMRQEEEQKKRKIMMTKKRKP